MPFLSPVPLLWIGTGVVSAGVPVILHLIHRRHAPQVLFSTLRFLRLCAERTARRQRIQDLLLLILRALLFFLLAFALAKPFLRARRAWGGKADTAIALILDNSASMGMVHRGERRFGRAKEVARSLITAPNLRSGRDACLLIITNGPESQVDAGLQNDLQRVETRINECELSVGFADLTSAVERAAEALAQCQLPNRELYVVTDLQANSWNGMRPDGRLASHADIPLVVINCGSADYDDLAVADLRIEGQGQVVEVPVTVRATLFNGSPRPVSRFASLYVNQERVANTPQAVEVAPGGTSEVTFTHTFKAAGSYAGWVRLDSDSLDLNNQRAFAATIADRLPVLLVKDRDAPVPYQDEAFFLAAALNPFTLLDVGEKWAIDPKTEKPDAVTPEVLREFPAVFLLNVQGVTPALAGVLADYVRQGGGLAIAAGDHVQAAVYNQVLGDIEGLAGGLLPARLVDVAGAPAGTDDAASAARPGQADLKHFALTPFAKFPSLYQNVLVYRHVRLEQPLPKSAEVLMALAGGDPLIVERRIGNGRVVFFATTLTNAWTNMPASHFYAPFLQRLVFYLAGSAGGGSAQTRSYTAGSPVRVAFPGVTEEASLDVTTPRNETIQVKTVAGEAGQEAVFGLTFEPGVYTYQSTEHQSVRGAFAVNPDPAEANLTAASWDDLRKQLPFSRAYYATDPAQLRERILVMRQGIQLWNVFLFTVLLIALVETFVANRVRPVHREGAGAGRPAGP